jgi:hypothetical protein
MIDTNCQGKDISNFRFTSPSIDNSAAWFAYIKKGLLKSLCAVNGVSTKPGFDFQVAQSSALLMVALLARIETLSHEF